MPDQYADIAFPTAVRRLFTYRMPDTLRVEPGVRVLAPLRNGTSIGMVIRTHSEVPSFDTRPLIRRLDNEPVIGSSLLKLTDWIHRFYYCSLGEVLQAALPSGVDLQSEHPLATPVIKVWDWKQGVSDTEIDQVLEHAGDYRWVAALRIIKERGLPAEQRILISEYGISRDALLRIAKRGVIEQREQRQWPEPPAELYDPEGISSLSDEQSRVFGLIAPSLEEESYQSFLLYGVTGSGKTEIYIHALKRVLEKGRGGLVLVPEIALTPQTVQRFFRIFGNQVAVLHSRLNDRERLDAWQALNSGEKRIAIGPRSAVFAPVCDLGLIIVDEEHDVSYKQFDPAPRYHARDVAIMRGVMENAVVIMGSATPALVTLHASSRGKHELLELPSRPVGSMPEVKVTDLRQYRGAMRGPISVALYKAISRALERGEQVILLYNRRGYASYLICEDCGHIPRSPDSSVSLTWHRRENRLRCHYTGYSRPRDRYCEECGSENLSSMGSGTQKIEEEIGELFPEARTIRMDRDTTTGKDSHRRIYEVFRNGKADILIGTQLVAKGLDFPNVTVVGVLHAETELAFPSWRAGERMFQLLSQVAGRAGRGEAGGVVFVETWKPDHRSIDYARRHDYSAFAHEELAERSQFAYPPFSRLLTIHYKGRSRQATMEVAEAFSEALRATCPDHPVLGPSPSVVERLAGRWHWLTSLKLRPGRNEREIEQLLEGVFSCYEEIRPKGAGSVRIAVDVDSVE